MDFISLELLFAGTIAVMAIAIELGYRVGNTHDPSVKVDREKITTINSNAILGMLGFILVFAFGIVYGRFETKKTLVREEANIIRDVWLRADFLPEQERLETQKKLMEYINLRIDAVQANDPVKFESMLRATHMIQHQMWDQAVVNARKDMNSDVAALYIESLNQMINQHAMRVFIGVASRLPLFLWIILYMLIFLGMFSIGYQTSISNSSRRSWLTPVMVISFSLVIILIAALDRPGGGFINISQQPLVDMKVWINEDLKNP